MSRSRLNTKIRKVNKVFSESDSPTSSPVLIDEDSDVELLEIEDSRPSSATPQTASMRKKIEINFDDVELLEIDDDDDEGEEEQIGGQDVKKGDKEHRFEEGEKGQDVQRINVGASQDAKDQLLDPSRTTLKNLKHLPIPIIIQTNNFPYLLAPIPSELQQKLPSKYKDLISLLDEYPMPGSTIHEVIDCIKETFRSLDNPFDERDELLIEFKEFDVTLAETCVHAYEVLLSEVYEAFEGLKRFKGSEAPTCLTLLLKPQRTFVNRLEELRKLLSDNIKSKEMIIDPLMDDKSSGTENLGEVNVTEDDLNSPANSNHPMQNFTASHLFENETSGESSPVDKNVELFNDKLEQQEVVTDKAVEEAREAQLEDIQGKQQELEEPSHLEEAEEEKAQLEEAQLNIEQAIIVEDLTDPAPTTKTDGDDERGIYNGEYSAIYKKEQSEPPFPDYMSSTMEGARDNEQHDSLESTNGAQCPSEMIEDEILYESNAKLNGSPMKHTLEGDEEKTPEAKKVRGE